MRCTRKVLWDRMELMEYLGEVRKLKMWERENQSGLGQPNRGKLKEKGQTGQLCVNMTGYCSCLGPLCVRVFVMVQGVYMTLGCSLLYPGASNIREIDIHR